jgi:nitric oxide reductase activation protein
MDPDMRAGSGSRGTTVPPSAPATTKSDDVEIDLVNYQEKSDHLSKRRSLRLKQAKEKKKDRPADKNDRRQPSREASRVDDVTLRKVILEILNAYMIPSYTTALTHFTVLV